MNQGSFSAENQNHQIDRTAEYAGGSVDYSILEGDIERRPFLIIPGFTGGRVALQNFATELNVESRRKVILPEQPSLAKHSKNQLAIINQHAEAILAIIKNEGLDDMPIDVITHSLGAVIAIKAAELAQAQGIRSFRSSEGSHAIFVAPAGSNDRENLFFLGGRWAKFIAKDTFYRPELDPTGRMAKAGFKNFTKDPAKTSKEILELRKKSSVYSQLGAAGLRPFILGYANDSMYPHKVIKQVLQDNDEALAGYSVPVDNGVVGAGSFNEFKRKTGLPARAAKRAWAHHYRNANHADLQYHPERTVKAILQVIG